MRWFNFTKKEKRYYASIEGVAREFGMSRGFIVDLLSNAGFIGFNLPFFRLTNSHLEIIANAYVDSVKDFYKISSKNFTSYDRNRQETLKEFFRKFIKKSVFFSTEFQFQIEINQVIQVKKNNRIFKEDLDSDLIRNFFFKKIEEIEIRELYSTNSYFILEGTVLEPTNERILIHRELKWRIKIKHTFNDIKSNIFTILISGHYHIFTAEEDLFTAFTSLKRCFSAVEKTLGEVLENFNSNLNPSWKIIYKTS